MVVENGVNIAGVAEESGGGRMGNLVAYVSRAVSLLAGVIVGQFLCVLLTRA